MKKQMKRLSIYILVIAVLTGGFVVFHTKEMKKTKKELQTQICDLQTYILIKEIEKKAMPVVPQQNTNKYI